MFGHDNQNNNHQQDEGGVQAPVQQTDSTFAAQPADLPQNDATDAPVNDLTVPSNTAGGGATDELLDIKHQALQALTPLVGQLEQTPEEQFRTTMMMIQASDDHGLIKVAYDAALKIGNEKERAQALLDIVNEINYFTQQT